MLKVNVLSEMQKWNTHTTWDGYEVFKNLNIDPTTHEWNIEHIDENGDFELKNLPTYWFHFSHDNEPYNNINIDIVNIEVPYCIIDGKYYDLYMVFRVNAEVISDDGSFITKSTEITLDDAYKNRFFTRQQNGGGKLNLYKFVNFHNIQGIQIEIMKIGIIIGDEYNNLSYDFSKAKVIWDMNIYSIFLQGKLNLLELNDFKHSEIHEIITPSKTDLPINTFDFGVVSSNEITQYYNYDIDVHQGDDYFGRFNIDSIEKTGNEVYKIHAIDMLGKVNRYRLDTYVSDLRYIEKRILGDLNIGVILDYRGAGVGAEVDYIIDISSPVQGYLYPNDYNYRHALCQLGFSMSQLIDDSRSSFIVGDFIYSNSIDYEITNDQIVGKAVYTKDNVFKKIVYKKPAYSIQRNGNNFYEETFDNIPTNVVTLIYRDELWVVENVICNTVNVNFAKPAFTSNAIVLYPATTDSISHASFTIQYSKVVKSTVEKIYTSQTDSNVSNSITIDKFTLFPYELSIEEDDLNISMNNYANSKGTVKAKILLTHGEKCGDIVRIPTCYGEVVEGIITEMTLHFGAIQTFADIVVTEWGNSDTTE